MRNHEQIFNEVREAFANMNAVEEVDVKRVEMALAELDDIKTKYAPDWEAVVMNTLVFVGVMAGTISAEVFGGGQEDNLHEELRTVFEVLAKYYAMVE